MKRLFVGVPLSEGVKGKLAPLLEKLKATGADLRLVAPENLHFTVKFLGDVDEVKIPEVQEKIQWALQGIRPFLLQLKGIGAFHDRQRINSVWVAAPNQVFVELMREVNEALEFIRKEEHKAEIPHATIARVKTGKNKEKLQQLLDEFKDADFGTMKVEKVLLYESELGKEGPVYKVVNEFKLPSRKDS